MHEIGFPYGSKTYTVNVPEFIKNDKNLAASFLRGYLDTDGCICFSKRYGKYKEFKRTRDAYPRILLSTVSYSLGRSLSELLTLLDFEFYSYIEKPARKNFHEKYSIHINGVSRFNKWLKIIGTSSSVKTSKIAIWQKFGYCPPNTSLEQRHNILIGKLSPETLYTGV